jgi:uncharacterized membrane protein YsdA (DUF1294 family)
MPVLAFGLLYSGVTAVWGTSPWIAGLYLASSVVCFSVYVADKSAAVAGRWRVPESTLLILGLMGGWPGAVVAQQLLRHKSSKAVFRAAFWATVALNVLVFAWLCTPLQMFFRR